MTLDERYKIQKKKNEKLKDELAALREKFANAVDEQVDQEVEKAMVDLTALMDAATKYYEEMQKDLAEAKKYKDEAKVIAATLREMEDKIFKRVPEPVEDEDE